LGRFSGPGFGFGAGVGAVTAVSDFGLNSHAQLENCEATSNRPAARTTSMPFMLEKQHTGSGTASEMLF
jgi:hypothetical protein